ncbi:MAG: DUF4430 domain-containing protein [Lachnospiraceae bacterium]|nr:DUF4430 domain-containing protein [Lachnospiraceae bacterium]
MEVQNAKKRINKGFYIGIGALVLLIAVLACVYYFLGPKGTEGSKEYTLKVVNDAGETTAYTGHTDQEFLRPALEELQEAEDFTIEGEESEYGLYVETVNGVTADYAVDGSYWALYVNDEYSNYGVDTQPVTDGDTYTLRYEK